MTTTTASTSELYWLSAVLLSIVDISAIFCLSQCIPPTRFRSARFDIPITAFIFWGGLWTALMANDYVWQWCYCFIFSNTERWVMPFAMALFYSALGFGMWWVAARLSWHPVITFSLLGALISLPDHYYAIVVKKVMETPLLSEVSTTSSVVFGFFEFAFYWILILSIAVFARSIYDWWATGRHNLIKHIMQP